MSSAFAVINAFPKRPLRLTFPPKRGLILVWAFFAIAMIGVVMGTYADGVAVFTEYRVHFFGTEAILSQASGYRYQHRYKGLGGTVSFEADYLTRERVWHHASVEFGTDGPLDPGSAFTVRYDPKSPDLISTNWGVACLGSRTFGVLVGAVIAVVIAVGLNATLLSWLGFKRKLRAIAAKPTAIEIRLDHLETGKSGLTAHYVSHGGGGRTISESFSFGTERQPYWLDHAKTRMLGLAAPNGQEILLDGDLSWVELTENERAVLERARASDSQRRPESVLSEYIDIDSSAKLFAVTADLRSLIGRGLLLQLEPGEFDDKATACRIEDVAQEKAWPCPKMRMLFQEKATGLVFRLQFDASLGNQRGSFARLEGT